MRKEQREANRAHLKRWPLIITTSILLIIAIATTAMLANTQNVDVDATVVNVRQGPGLSYGVEGQVTHGTQLAIIDKQNSWYKVRMPGNRVGWVASWLVNNNEATTGAAKSGVTTAAVNVRASSTESASKLGSLKAGAAIKVVYQEGAWSQIIYDGTAAWISSKYVKLSGTSTTVSTSDQAVASASAAAAANLTVKTKRTANLRHTAGINGSVAKELPANTSLAVVGESGDWYEVKTSDGTTGYIASWVVSTPSNGASTATSTSLAEATIVLDPGHGGSDTGALSTTNKYEKTYTLKTAEAIRSALAAAGANVVMTRSTDSFVSLAKRPKIAHQVKADEFISIHFDSTPDTNEASGHTVYYYSSKKDISLARNLNVALKGVGTPSRGIEFGDFEVLRDNKQPSVLLEMGYINDDTDFSKIQTTAYQQKVANDVVNGLRSYFESGSR